MKSIEQTFYFYEGARRAPKKHGVRPRAHAMRPYANGCVMTLWKRLQHFFKPLPDENRVYGFDEATARTVQALAQKEGRSFEQMLSDLLSMAIGWRLSIEETRQLWRRLTPREQQVAILLSRGYTNRQIAEALVISPDTAKTHVHNAVHKFGLRDRTQLYQTLAGWEFEGFE